MSRQKLFRTPKLYDAGGNISKPWWVEIGYRDPRTSEMVRKRYLKGFAALQPKKRTGCTTPDGSKKGYEALLFF